MLSNLVVNVCSLDCFTIEVPSDFIAKVSQAFLEHLQVANLIKLVKTHR